MKNSVALSVPSWGLLESYLRLFQPMLGPSGMLFSCRFNLAQPSGLLMQKIQKTTPTTIRDALRRN